MTADKISEVMNRQYNANAGHIGIYNIRERIHLLYGPEYDMVITSLPDQFTRFEITLPLITGGIEDNAQNIAG